MIVTIEGKYIIGTPEYLKTKTVCSMHANLSQISAVELLIPKSLIAKYNLLRFDNFEPEIESRFRNLFLITIAIEYKKGPCLASLGIEIHISQNDVSLSQKASAS